MAGVTQTIPQYSAGISEQPDNLKFPGQVVESIKRNTRCNQRSI